MVDLVIVLVRRGHVQDLEPIGSLLVDNPAHPESGRCANDGVAVFAQPLPIQGGEVVLPLSNGYIAIDMDLTLRILMCKERGLISPIERIRLPGVHGSLVSLLTGSLLRGRQSQVPERDLRLGPLRMRQEQDWKIPGIVVPENVVKVVGTDSARGQE